MGTKMEGKGEESSEREAGVHLQGDQLQLLLREMRNNGKWGTCAQGVPFRDGGGEQ